MKQITFKDIVTKIEQSNEYLIFSVGDSLTEGQRATSADNTYTAVFSRMLAKMLPQKTVIRYDGKRHKHPESELMPIATYGEPKLIQEGNCGKLTVVRSGIGGNTLRRLLNRKDDYIGKEIDGRIADLFIFSFGINDSIIDNPAKYITPENFYKELYELMQHIEGSNPNADVIFMTPTWHDHGDKPTSSLDPYAEAMLTFAKEKGLLVIDMHKLWMDHLIVGGVNYGQGDWLGGDSCHPGDIGHAQMAKEMIRCIFEQDKN